MGLVDKTHLAHVPNPFGSSIALTHCILEAKQGLFDAPGNAWPKQLEYLGT